MLLIHWADKKVRLVFALHMLAAMWTTTGGEVCQSFVHLPDKWAKGVETYHKVGDGYRDEECKQACLDSTDFVCVAAQMQPSATCFIGGFRRRYDYNSEHYTRVCERGQYTRTYTEISQCSLLILFAWSHCVQRNHYNVPIKY